ncbi:MAG: hypothetical protein PHQ27_10355, partial [Victivallales bacterium]|nr:hypothetical protein [Victivallales bacterium]
IDAGGNISLRRTRSAITEMTLESFLRTRDSSDALLEVVGYKSVPTGGQVLLVKTYYPCDFFRSDRISGNFRTGLMEFDKFFAGYKNFFCRGESATRSPAGTITVMNADVTSCEYVENEQEHYSFGCRRLEIRPRSNPNDLSDYNFDRGQHSYWGYDCTLNIAGLPVMWVPMIYAPDYEGPGICQIQGGSDSDWGYFVQTSKKFHLYDYPNTDSRFYLDYYSKHGIGYGNETWIDTEQSKTQLFFYNIYDNHPSFGDNDRDRYRLELPSQRYDIKLSNLTHLTSRLDFRGNFEKISDYYFLDDYFSARATNDPQPSTYAGLEYQFDDFSLGGYFSPRVNDFDTKVQTMPEFRLDVPRQELFKNLYYQGETSAGYYRMMFRNYDSPRTSGNKVDPASYDAIRFDTLHSLYYPINLDWLNFIPRVSQRLTYYNKSSEQKIDYNDLTSLFIADDPELPNNNATVVNYDNYGGYVMRYAAEIGFEANTKIYRSWQNVRNHFWGLDGLRHVFVPYTNYTFLPKPTTSADYLYYFDDTDRLDEQNFSRIGFQNRLQTRRGNYGAESIYEWASMENYIDYHYNQQDDFNHLGDFGTILNFKPTSRLSYQSLLLIDAGGSKDDWVKTQRYGYQVSRCGPMPHWVNKWNNTIRYQVTDDLSVYLAYNYQDAYQQRSIYSMGSTLTDIESGSAFRRSYSRNQTINMGFETALPFERDTKIGYDIYYDVEAGFVTEQRAKIAHRFHCWEVALIASRSQSRDDDGDREADHSVMATLTLTAMPGVKIGQNTAGYQN